MKEDKPKKVNHAPPGWIVSWFDNVKLDPQRAQQFADFRQRLCDATGVEDHIDYPFLHHNQLWMKALDLLLAHEEELIKKIEGMKK